ncbi:glycosyltransferase [Antarcticibacterium sp. 1MA-6-2]|uniref:glycosyltransferase n=1 Tax=Antarcticibacterium sp. 1MA-6-2 TaxID=2908210 RepID=UPI001F227043|nr:glycosyltransferase [Antarcticibacterium sp. 1MA-6-2]UJH91747.1 glycosyltransferase [Antarcticibacterium sp. 1MA-6-2]
MAQPRVLILNQPFVDNTGGGITLSNLFANWDRDKLAVACSGYLLTDNMNHTLCNHYYQLGDKERKWIFPFNLLSRKYYSGPIMISDGAENQDKVIVKKSKLRVKMILDYILPVFNYVGLSHFQAKTGVSPELCNWLDSFKPDILYVQSHTREDILFAIELYDYLKIPMVFHMMDDWPTTVGIEGPMKNHWKRKIDKEFRLLLDRANLCLGISDYMAEEYKRRYGKKFVTFHNPINLEFWKKAQRNSYELPTSPTLLYAGRIGLGIDKSLKIIAEAVKEVNNDLKSSIKFIIQSQDAPTWIKNFTNVYHQEFVAYEDLPKVFAQAEVLILPYDFSPESTSFIKYSMPTKASEYMASGTPILIFAPQDTALVQYAEKYSWAEVVTENNIKVLSEKLKDMFLDESRRERVATTAKSIAANRHNSTVVAGEFEKIISTAAEEK